MAHIHVIRIKVIFAVLKPDYCGLPISFFGGAIGAPHGATVYMLTVCACSFMHMGLLLW